MKLLARNEMTDGTLRLQVGESDDFLDFNTGDRWTSVLTDSGSAAVSDAANGVLVLLPSDSSVADNDEAYVRTTKEVVLFAADKPVTAWTRLKITEANTDDANVAFGLMDAVAANSILDDGGGPKASYSGAVIFKADGDAYWSCESSIGSTQTTNRSNLAVTSGTFVDFRIECQPKSSTTVDITFWADGQIMKDYTTELPIVQTITFGSPTEMCLFAGVKNGGANQETLSIDYLGFTALR